MTPDHINYYDSGRRDLQGLSATTLRSIPKDEYDEYTWKPEGFGDFFAEECIKVHARANDMDTIFSNTPIGRKMRGTFPDDPSALDPDKT